MQPHAVVASSQLDLNALVGCENGDKPACLCDASKYVLPAEASNPCAFHSASHHHKLCIDSRLLICNSAIMQWFFNFGTLITSLQPWLSAPGLKLDAEMLMTLTPEQEVNQ